MSSRSGILVLYVVLSSVISGCSEADLSEWSWEERAFIYLVSIPFLLFNLISFTKKTFVHGVAIFIALILWVAMSFSFVNVTRDPGIPYFISYGLAALWAAMGYYAGSQAYYYVRLAHPLGYLFTIGTRLIGIGLSVIIIEVPFSQIMDGASVNLWEGITNYGVTILVGISLLVFLGPKLAHRGIKTAFKEIFATLTLFGIASFLVNFFWQSSLSELFWWLPGTPPNAYQIFFTLAISLMAALPPYTPSRIFSKRGDNPDATTGSLIAVGREGAMETVMLPLRMARFSYKLPKDWLVVDKAEDLKHFSLWLKPPGGLLDRLKATRLDLLVFQYSNDTINDQDEFKRATYVNLTDATIIEDRIGSRYGVLSHECVYKKGISYGYVVRFITHSNEFVIRWHSFDGEAFHRHRAVVESFIDGFQFDTLQERPEV